MLIFDRKKEKSTNNLPKRANDNVPEELSSRLASRLRIISEHHNRGITPNTMVRSGFDGEPRVVVVAGHQIHQQPTDFNRSPDYDPNDETNSDYYFYKQV